MKVGDLCRVITKNSHQVSQKDDLVMIIKPHICVKDTLSERGIPKGTDIPQYVEGMNLKTLKFHHYRAKELEVISESR